MLLFVSPPLFPSLGNGFLLKMVLFHILFYRVAFSSCLESIRLPLYPPFPFVFRCRPRPQERTALEKDPLEFVISIESVGDNISEWDVTLMGPSDSPYVGGKFVLRMTFPKQYPFQAPQLTFQTKVYHPSVQSASGQVCQAVLGTWGPTLTASHCLQTVYSMLQAPTPDNPLEDDIAQQLQEKPKEFERTARKWTKDYAK
jgi:ubiquitin-conjugating enzyme E2 D/E